MLWETTQISYQTMKSWNSNAFERFYSSESQATRHAISIHRSMKKLYGSCGESRLPNVRSCMVYAKSDKSPKTFGIKSARNGKNILNEVRHQKLNEKKIVYNFIETLWKGILPKPHGHNRKISTIIASGCLLVARIDIDICWIEMQSISKQSIITAHSISDIYAQHALNSTVSVECRYSNHNNSTEWDGRKKYIQLNRMACTGTRSDTYSGLIE